MDDIAKMLCEADDKLARFLIDELDMLEDDALILSGLSEEGRQRVKIDGKSLEELYNAPATLQS